MKQTGKIYLIADFDAGSVKIGYSKNPKKRLKQLQTGNPGKLFLIATMTGSIPDEQEIHKRIEKHRLEGEWFKISAVWPEILRFLHRAEWHFAQSRALVPVRKVSQAKQVNPIKTKKHEPPQDRLAWACIVCGFYFLCFLAVIH